MQAEMLAQWIPEMHRGYELALAHGLIEPTAQGMDAGRLATISRGITHQVDRSNTVIDMVLASSRMDRIDPSDFRTCSMEKCVREAVDTYPYRTGERERIRVASLADFRFRGSESLMVYVLFNLIKNSLFAIHAAGKGEIFVSAECGPGACTVTFRDTGPGIPAAALPRVFEAFYTTKKAQGAGIGLAFCRRVIGSFGATMTCSSAEGEHTTFTMVFPTALR
jgi:signal transduction histidine kinase